MAKDFNETPDATEVIERLESKLDELSREESNRPLPDSGFADTIIIGFGNFFWRLEL